MTAPRIERRFSPRRLAAIRSHPLFMTHRIADPRWALPTLRIAVVSDVHACIPWTPLSAVRRIVERVNDLAPDMILLPGDFIADRKLPALRLPAADIVRVLGELSAPLGVHSVMGNHDWWDCQVSQLTQFRENTVLAALEAEAGIVHLRNAAVRIAHGSGFWLVGIDSQHGLKHLRRRGFHDPDAAFAGVTDDAPAILMAHEPDYFAEGDERAFLQISGHTHGGQANLFGWRPITPSRYGGRYAWGHVREGGRHLIVSGGVGFSGLPLRLLQPPEITLIELSGAA